MSRIIYHMVEAIYTTYLIFIVLNLSVKKQSNKYIIIVLLITLIKSAIYYYLKGDSLSIRTIACIPIQLFICYILLKRNFLHILFCVSLEYIVLELCKFFILLMIGTPAEEMYKYENAIKVFSYLQLLVVLLFILNYKQHEIITNKDFYIKNAENTLFNLRRQKHNFDNVLNTITGLINLEQYNKLKDFIISTQTEANEIQKCKNVCLAALITQKINSFNRKIKLYIKIRSGIENLNISDNELCECVGILLDNAYEAAMLTEEPYIGIEIFDVMENTVIKIRNNCREIIDKKMFFKKGYTTKGKGRGIGLFIVKAIMTKYGNDLDVMVEGNEVRFSLIIHPEDKESQLSCLQESRIPAACYSRIHEKT